MPWKDTCVMDLRTEFVLRALREEKPFVELCLEYGISRKTGYKWKERYLADGRTGLHDLSRRPLTSPSEIGEDTVCEIIRIKQAHPSWGPLKIREVYARNRPHTHLPSESTFKRLLDKAGFVKKRKTRRHDTCGRIENRITPHGPNDLWTTDFKGWWYTCDRQRCEPLTVRDEYSRFILCASPLHNSKSDTVRSQFEKLFEKYGLPSYIRSDNGSPFACTSAPLGLSRLSAWWVSLGIHLDRIPPARPDQNGAHERMHRDIAAEVQSIPRGSLRDQAASLETWRNTFNLERPHQALGMRVPAEIYNKSSRPYTGTPDNIEYPSGYIIRKVSSSGYIKIEGLAIPISTTLCGWTIGIKPGHPDHYDVWFGPLCLGNIDIKTESFHPLR